jgi:hypothetical protein
MASIIGRRFFFMRSHSPLSVELATYRPGSRRTRNVGNSIGLSRKMDIRMEHCPRIGGFQQRDLSHLGQAVVSSRIGNAQDWCATRRVVPRLYDTGNVQSLNLGALHLDDSYAAPRVSRHYRAIIWIERCTRRNAPSVDVT